MSLSFLNNGHCVGQMGKGKLNKNNYSWGTSENLGVGTEGEEYLREKDTWAGRSRDGSQTSIFLIGVGPTSCQIKCKAPIYGRLRE